MTPFAARIAKELTLPRKRRTKILSNGNWNEAPDDDLFPDLRDIHCFECSEVIELAMDLVKRRDEKNDTSLKSIMETSIFLPAPRTWIEWTKIVPPNGKSIGVHCSTACLLEVKGDVIEVRNFMKFYRPDVMLVRAPAWLGLTGGTQQGKRWAPPEDEGLGYAIIRYLLGLLAFINSPRAIGRQQHPPERWLVKRLRENQKTLGDFSLRAWTEIKLEVTPPEELSAEAEGEMRLTGKKALHFCRKHIRIRLGRVEFVRAHWRGDPAHGIKRADYSVVQ